MLRWLRRLVAVAIVLVLVVVAFAWFLLRGSLPRLDGELALAGLAKPVTATRDAVGAVTITATSGEDAWRAMGYVHAQERYFEMDLMRRVAAGELAELFGAAALDADRGKRLHRFRARASAALAQLAPDQRARLDAYVAGVNAGREALAVRPFPYLLLRQQPAAWRAEDSALVVYAMFIDLQDENNARELAFAKLRGALPEAYVALLDTRGSEWDAPLIGEPYAPPALPDASVVDLRTIDPARFGAGANVTGDIGVGSNNFGVGGALTANGAALVANDMHLGLRVPNIWFRARLKYDGVDVAGVTLPGVPGVVAGSNGHVAWGYTNSYGDWLDWVQVTWRDAAHTRYATAAGEATVETHDEIIHVQGAPDETLRVRETIWGPIAANDETPGALALAWTAHRPRALNFDLIDMERASSVDDALAIAHRAGMPAQNLLVGDRDGHLAWTLIGAIPKRVGGYDATRPSDWSQPGVGWDGWLEPEAYPQVVDPASHRIWTANARVVDGAWYDLIGAGEYALGARAKQIRDDLFAKERFAPADLLAIQLDDRTLFQQRWWQLLRDTLARQAPDDAALRELAAATARWDEHASTDAVAYRLVRAFRVHVHAIVTDALGAPMRGDEPAYILPGLSQSEAIVWALLQQRPMNLLSPHYADWDALLVDAARRTANDFAGQPGGLAARTWGERNTSKIAHPISRAVPFLARFLDMPARALPGDGAMPRVQGPSFGASERFAVSPGHESEGYLHMPGGQSGHPLSPYYGAGHVDWEEGRATPFLPGAAEHTLTFTP